MEKKFRRNSDLKAEYFAFIKEYFEIDHMVEIINENLTDKSTICQIMRLSGTKAKQVNYVWFSMVLVKQLLDCQ